MNNTKRTPAGGRVNPMPVPDGYESRFEPMTDKQYEQAQNEARDVANAVHAGQEWEPGSFIGDFMERWSGSAEMSPILRTLLQRHIVSDPEMTWAQAAAEYVRMDDPAVAAMALRDWANTHSWDINNKVDRCPPPNTDFISRAIYPIEHMLKGICDAMDRGFVEKAYWETRGHARPEEYWETGPLITAYPEGCPAHGERPAGHGVFCGHLAKKALWLYNGHDDDILVFFRQIGLSRVLSLMHIAQSCEEGFLIGLD